MDSHNTSTQHILEALDELGEVEDDIYIPVHEDAREVDTSKDIAPQDEENDSSDEDTEPCRTDKADDVRQGAQSRSMTVCTPQDRLEEKLGNTDKEKTFTTQKKRPVWLMPVIIVLLCACAFYVGAHYKEWTHTTQAEEKTQIGTNNLTQEEEQKRIKELEEILKDNPEDYEAHLELGVLIFDEKNVSEALAHWEKAVEINPKSVPGWFNLGFAYQSMTPPDMDKAQKAWNKVVELDPDSDLAQTVQMHSDMFSSMTSQSPSTDTSGDDKLETGNTSTDSPESNN